MPLTQFICPNQCRMNITNCLASCIDRCMSLPTLKAIADGERVWSGRASTTQLLKGTRQAYLEITQDYAVSPDEYAFALIGTRHHKILDTVAKTLDMISEKKLDGEVSGILDLLVSDNNGGFEPWDYKTSGSYKIANALKLTKEAPHLRDWELQINHYRIMLEAVGFKITRQVVQATARDGGLASSKRLGITRKINVIEIQRLDDDDEVVNYFTSKNNALQSALKDGVIPPMCDYEERWANRKCSGYCTVVDYCPEGLKMKGEK